MPIWNIVFMQMQQVFNDRIHAMGLKDVPTCCDRDAIAVLIQTAIAVKKNPTFRSLTDREICFVLVYNYYWVQYPDSSRWLTDNFFKENIKEPRRALCRELNDLIHSLRPHLAMDTLYGGFDIIVIVSLHGETCDEKGNAFSPEHFKAAAKPMAEPYPFILMEAVPCGVTYFVSEAELSTVMGYVEDLREDEHFLQNLQGRLMELKCEKHSQSDEFHEFEDDPEFVEFHQCTHNFNIVPHEGGYLERIYEYDKEPGLGFNVAYAKGRFKRGDNLMHHLTPIGNKKNPEFSRTQLLTLLRSSGYKMPLIIDLSCGCFDDDLPKPLVAKFKRDAEDRGLSGGKSRRSVKKKRTLKKRKYIRT